MHFYADLHIHSRYSRACSRDCDLEHLAWWAGRKGITVVNTPVTMVDEFTKDSKDAWKDMVGKIYSQEELDMVIKYRDEYRAKHKK